VVGGGQVAAVQREDQPENLIRSGSGEEPRLVRLYIQQRHFAAATCEGGERAARSHGCHGRVGEGKWVAFSFGETECVPQTEGVIGVNSEKMTAIWRKAERRSVTAPSGAN